MAKTCRWPIQVPQGVELELLGVSIRAKGPLGEMTVEIPAGAEPRFDGGEVRFEGEPRLAGLARALTRNLIRGVVEGFERRLEIHGIGYRAQVAEGGLILWLGFSHQIRFPLPEGVSVEVLKTPRPDVTELVLRGMDRQVLGLVAAQIRGLRPPNPYTGKGVRYKEEKVRRKVGKRVVGLG